MILAVPDPTGTLIGGAGVAGVWVVTFLIGQIHSDKDVEHEREEFAAQRARDDTEMARLRAMIDTLLAVYHTEILPTLADYEKKLAPALASTQEVLKRMEWIIEEYERGQRRGDFSPPPSYGPAGYRSPGRPDPDYRHRGGLGQGPGPGDGPPSQSGPE